MLFSSIPFLYYFLPIVVAVYYTVPKPCKNFVLLISSLFFYGWGEPKYIFLMVIAIVAFYICGILIEKSKTTKVKKIWLTISIVSSIVMLGLFKYADFFIENFNKITGFDINLLRLALPIGISFYTFQCLSYTIDVYRGDVKAQRNIISFGTYVSLFPQLIAGPIVRYVDIEKEINNRSHSWKDFEDGLFRFLIGLAKKILIANQMGVLINAFRDSMDKSVLFYWLYAIAFMLHIYFDFSGYSDMAIGLGRIFGFHFIENFNYPYMSKSVSEFWRRWHMSLGSWFRDYVYIPLGGNRVSKPRWIFNVFVVWALTGLWHGADWNFVIWGLFYAVCLIAEKYWYKEKAPTINKRVRTLFLVMIGFIIFNASGMTQAIGDIAGLFGWNYETHQWLPFYTDITIYYIASYIWIFTFGIIGSTPFVKEKITQWKSTQKGGQIIAVLQPLCAVLLLIICTAYLVDGSFNPFLYFRF